MDFFLEIHNGECGLGGHFCDHQRDHGPSLSSGNCFDTEVRSQNQEEEINQGESTLLIYHIKLLCRSFIYESLQSAIFVVNSKVNLLVKLLQNHFSQ